MVKNLVTQWRTERGVSKAHLARRVGVCRAYVTRLEKGEIQPSGEVMLRIAEYFKCPVEQIFQRVSDKCKRSLKNSPALLGSVGRTDNNAEIMKG